METLIVFSTILVPMATLAQATDLPSGHWRVYVGTYTGQGSEGIYLLDFDAQSGQLTKAGLAAKMENPSFLGVHPMLPVLYAVGEGGADGGTVSAFRIDAEGGLLSSINRQSSVGDGPCHVAVSPSGRHVAVANYGGGSVALFPVSEDGALGEACAFVQHEGSGPDPRRQEKPHAHSVYFDKSGRHLFVADLGLDKIMLYDVDDEKGTLTPHEPPFSSVDPGAGPRHMAFLPNGRFAYVVNEMGNTVTAFSYAPASASFTALQTVPTLPDDFPGHSTTAEIVVHPTGRFLYASNRGHDSIATYGVDEKTGTLTLIGHTPTGGRTPRNFEIDPSGNYLLAANQDSDTIVVFHVDPNTGALEATGRTVEVGSPVCVTFARP